MEITNVRTIKCEPEEFPETKLSGVNEILFDGRYYKIVEKRNSTPYEKKMIGLIAVCQLCFMRVRGSLRVSSNFVHHLREKHPPKYEEFQNKKLEMGKCLRIKQSTDGDFLNFICETSSPLSIVEQPSFSKIFSGKKVPSRHAITKLLIARNAEFKLKISTKLVEIEYVCATVDIWCGGKRTFLGYTCHWVEADTLERKSVALACRRFRSLQYFHRITDLIEDIKGEYHIPDEKVVYIITDNGSNFVEELTNFGVVLKENNEEGSDNEDSCDDDNQSEIFSPDFHNYTPISSKHFQSASHSLNLLATCDYMEIINSSTNQAIRSIHEATFSSCTKLWNICKRTKYMEKISTILPSQLTTPDVTGWNTLYQSVQYLIEHKHLLDELCYKLKMPFFENQEILYLEEYARVMQPIAEAIDFLQREQNTYFGYFIPTLVTIKVKMRRLAAENLKLLREVHVHMQLKLLQRFQKYFHLHSDCWDAIIAAIVIPEIKLKFCNVLLESAQSYTTDNVREKFKEYAKEFKEQPEVDDSKFQPSTSAFLEFDEDFKEEKKYDPHGESLATEIFLYLSDDEKSIQALHRFPVIKKMFLKYNTPLPSSAPVEKLFSFAEIVNLSERQNLCNSYFEMMVLKKANGF